MRSFLHIGAILFVSAIAMTSAQGAPDREMLELRNTVVNLVDALVQQGVLSAEQADTLKSQAREKAAADAQGELEKNQRDEQAAEQAAAELTGDQDVVRVSYVPEFVKDDIRMQVRAELREDVTEDVISIAKQQRWGLKDALPEWVNTFRFYGNFRLREQSDLRIRSSALVPDFRSINEAGGIQRAGDAAFFNTTEDSHRLRARLRLHMDMKPIEGLTIYTRLITGQVENPLSANLTFADGGPKNFEVVLDRAYMQWDETNLDGDDWLTLRGGRMPVPFLHTFMLWDPDLNLDGLNAEFRYRFGGGGDLFGMSDRNHLLYLRGAAFVIDTDELTVDDGQSNDTYLLAAQLGYQYSFDNQSSLEVAAALYDYVNIVGVRNRTLNSTLKDFTAADFVQIGNSVFDIRNDLDPSTNLFGRASDFTLVNLTGRFNYTGFAPIHMGLTADIVSNIGYSEQDVLERTGVRIPKRNLGYAMEFDIGWPQISKWGDWQVSGGYKYLQRDATLDALNDSNFHGGGTNGKGWWLQGMYGLTTHTWLRARYFATDEIDGQPFAVDILQLDLNARF